MKVLEKKIKKMMMDLKYLMNHGEVDMDIADVRYQKMLFGALEATGKDYTLHVGLTISKKENCTFRHISRYLLYVKTIFR
ncbi:hypothetical protein BHU24_07850 [Bacillus pseudomycoides]|nr:hypothetical protein [Bacillus pseudomycoides]PEE02971.1 hypothetical protein CON86_28140 [Bacillus pseudomycoides]PEJ27301.1 hypothetical protein CN677_27915 [Bacillus pseudomycoides]PEM78903.1 hypothetical protein CN632_06120 [Bacillus pseudomycoides]PEO85162.1 hypothetical protein CN571_21960 [Bacillus pseudomycoides]